MTKAKVYNINAMRPAFVKMYESGNKGTITKKVCSELGISETYFDWYKASIEKLFNTVCAYCRVKNSPKAKPEEVKAALEAIYPAWKEMLSTAERDKMTKELRVTEHDISNLVGFCQVFVNNRNDTSRGKDENFVAQKMWAVEPLKKFQKKVEIDLGIRIAQVDVMSDAERDFLSAERKILGKWKKAERRIEDIAASKEKLLAIKAKAKSIEAKTIMDEQIAELDEQVKKLNEKIDQYKADHHKLLNPDAAETTDEKVIPPAPVAAAEPKKRTRKAKKAVESETVEVKKD